MKENDVIIKQSSKVNAEEVWGDYQKVVDITGLGSGKGFEIDNANLPKGWESSSLNIEPKVFAGFYSSMCEDRGLQLQEMSFDPNKILTEAIIRDKNNILSRLYLDNDCVRPDKGKYLTDNLHKIGAAVLFQDMISRYLGYCWGNKFDYGYIDGLDRGGYMPVDLKVPKDIFEKKDQITNAYYQNGFCNQAHNIAGRFGLELKDVNFDDRGILHSVNVAGDSTYYSLADCGQNMNRKYVSHNVDSAEQAAVLHGIVSLYINYLLGRKHRL